MPEMKLGKRVMQYDEVDEELVRAHEWRAVRKGRTYHAIAWITDNSQGMFHTLAMKPPTNHVVRHVNGKGLDNRRENLQVLTRGRLQKARLKSNKERPVARKDGRHAKYVGVYVLPLGESPAGRQWQVCHEGQQLSTHYTAEAAARNYDHHVRLLNGPTYSPTNFPY